jgi:preprotein translocase subunit SecG
VLAGLFDEFFGVPTHPFAVHAPIVLLPIAAVATVVLTVRSDWRRRIWWAMPATVLVLFAMLFVAKESGEAVLDSQNVFGNVDRHQELGEQTVIIAFVWLVGSIALAVRDRQTMSTKALSSDVASPPRDAIALGLGIVVALIAVVATIWLIRTGHAGAESRWVIG